MIFSLNRNMFQFTGYIFDKRLNYKPDHLGIQHVGGSRHRRVRILEIQQVDYPVLRLTGDAPGQPYILTGSFPYFVQPERSMADQFFRPGFTQGHGSTWGAPEGYFT